MADVGILAAGNLLGSGSIAQQLQKQVGQTGIPAYNVSNACATGATALRTAIMAVKAGEVDMGLAVGVEKLAGAGLLGAGVERKPTMTSGSATDASVRWVRSMGGSAPNRCQAYLRKSVWSMATSTVGPISSCSQRSARRTMPIRR